jgi:putative membrane protein
MSFLQVILDIIIGALISGLIIWIVGRLNLGISVTGFGPAVIAGIVIAVISSIIAWLLGVLGISIGGGLLGGIIYLIIAAIVLMLAGNMVPGLTVNGFTGALIAAIAIGIVGWLIGLVLGAIGV